MIKTCTVCKKRFALKDGFNSSFCSKECVEKYQHTPIISTNFLHKSGPGVPVGECAKMRRRTKYDYEGN